MSRFPKVFPFLLSPLVVAAVVTLAACSSDKPKFQDDQLLSSAPSPFAHSFNYASADACEASRRALLSQGYVTTMTHNDTVDATKDFQPTTDSHIVVEVHVVCTAADASNTSMVYVNAVQSGYALKKSDTSASVGLSILGSVSLPIRSNSDSMVKISSETIQSGGFYDRFFELVGRYLNTVARSQPVPGSGAIKITPLPPVVEPVTTSTMPAPAVTAPVNAGAGAPVGGALAPVMSPAMAATMASPAAATSHPASVPVSATTPAAALAPVAPAAPAALPAVVQSGAATGVAIPVSVTPGSTGTAGSTGAADHSVGGAVNSTASGTGNSAANSAPASAEPPVLASTSMPNASGGALPAANATAGATGTAATAATANAASAP